MAVFASQGWGKFHFLDQLADAMLGMGDSASAAPSYFHFLTTPQWSPLPLMTKQSGLTPDSARTGSTDPVEPFH